MPPISTNNYRRSWRAQYLGALFRGGNMKLATLKDNTRDGKLIVSIFGAIDQRMVQAQLP
jgi:hypothetical protein